MFVFCFIDFYTETFLNFLYSVYSLLSLFYISSILKIQVEVVHGKPFFSQIDAFCALQFSLNSAILQILICNFFSFSFNLKASNIALDFFFEPWFNLKHARWLPTPQLFSTYLYVIDSYLNFIGTENRLGSDVSSLRLVLNPAYGQSL